MHGVSTISAAAFTAALVQTAVPNPAPNPALNRAPKPARMAPLAVRAWTVITAVGAGIGALGDAVRAQRSGLQALAASTSSTSSVSSTASKAASAPPTPALPAWVGRVAGLDRLALPAAWSTWDCRATRLAHAGLQTDDFSGAVRGALERHGASRVGLVLGTSASTIAASEQAYRTLTDDGAFPPGLRHPPLHSPHALAAFVALVLGLGGPVVTVSTACASSARAFGQAERWLRLNLVDAVVVGGVDALCDSVLYGFHALGLVAPESCRPFDVARRGISVGEAAGYALLERARPSDDQPRLLGYGEANDAHHMSSPHPQGLGAERSLDDALARAGATAEAIGYVNLHGTATPQNDAVEAALVARRYGAGVHASATKGMTGHAMGAAGIVEAALCLLAVQTGWRSGSAGLSQADPAFGPRFARQLQTRALQAPVALAASHSFGFGGNNSVLVFGSAA